MNNIASLLAPPKMPDGLHFLRRIGNGAAGELFMVSDITGQTLALKVIRSQWREREMQALQTLRKLPSHPALAQIFHAGELADGSFFYTMELADNLGNDHDGYRPDTLAHRIQDHAMPLAELLQTISMIALGAEHLHKHDIAHGDIKPENVIFVNGQPKLADFGTLAADHAGTIGFAPDNPVSGIDRDCYALGKTLYCAWSGLDATSFPTPPEKFEIRDFRVVRRIYLRACHPSARRRFASAAAFAAALETAMPQAKHRPKRLLAGALALIVTGLVLILLLAGREKTPHDRPPQVFSAEPVPLEDSGLQTEKEAALWLKEHAKEAEAMRSYGIIVKLRPHYGLEYHDTNNGFRGVGLDNLLAYWKIRQKNLPLSRLIKSAPADR